MHIQFQLAQQCIQISTRIKSSSVHTYIFVCFNRNSLHVILQGFVDPIMQHGVRIEAVFASLQQGEHMVESTCFQSFRQVQQFCEQNYFQRRGERRSKERFFNLSSSTVVFPHSYKIPSNTKYSTVFLHAIQQLQVILHTELILLQEILQLQGSSHAGFFQQLFPMSPSILHGRIRLPASLQHSKAIQHKQASSEFYPVETAFQAAGSIHAVPTVAPRPVLHYRILPGEIGFFPKG